VTGFQVASSFLKQGLYKNILVVSSEIASVGLNYNHLESASLFGDGAVAFVLGQHDKSLKQKPTELLGFHMETYSSGWDTCQIAGGGTKFHPSRLDWRLTDKDERFMFSMNGPKVFRMASKLRPGFIEKLSEKSGVTLDDAKFLIPHQASDSALELIRRRLDLAPERMIKIIEEHGNMIAASIPLALHYALQTNRLESNDIVYLVGTSAGFSIGGLVLRI
jgi:3-oxoacyl-[acyl-carrier-protein] synthase-3